LSPLSVAIFFGQCSKMLDGIQTIDNVPIDILAFLIAIFGLVDTLITP
jgi:hypothetical protein